MTAFAVPAGYLVAQQVQITGGGAAASGSTNAPTTTGTDYVVGLHLTGAAAAALYAFITDTGALSDVSLWWDNGTAWVQIDCDPDTDTFGPWSSSNIYVRWKLQAALAASPATSSAYLLAVGQGAAYSGLATTMQSWANIYPLSDGFDGVQGTMGSTASSLGTGTTGWTATPNTGGSITVSGGTLNVVAAANATSAASYLQAKVSFTTGYCVETCLAYSTAPASGHTVIVGISNVAISTYIFVGLIGAVSTAQYEAFNHFTTTTGSLPLGTLAGVGVFKTLAAARDASSVNGAGYAAGGGAALARVGTTTLTTAALPTLDVQPPANVTQTGTYRWVKVRPFMAVEPSVAAFGSVVIGDTWPAGSGLLTWQSNLPHYRM